jgi:RNA polymerase sigma-70 factor (ECF subfamily)
VLVLITRLLGLGRKKEQWPPPQPIAQIPDEDLMEMYARGLAPAFEVLLQRHERGIFNFILRSVHNRARAEDLTQEVFLRVIKSADRYQRSARFTTWLYTIARNLCIDNARRKNTRKELSLDQKHPHDDGDDGRSLMDQLSDPHAAAGAAQITRQQFRQQLQLALHELPEEQREVFLLREVSGLKFREIADITGIPENTVKSRMRYALETLRGHLEAFRDHSFDLDEAQELGHS